MVFGRDYAAPLDVTAHEVTHGITNNELGLPYEGETGALSEAISDIFASNIDSDDWEIGEELPNGAIRAWSIRGASAIPPMSTTTSTPKTTTAGSTPTARSRTRPT